MALENSIQPNGIINPYRKFWIRLLFFATVFLPACVYDHTALEVEFGNNYYFIGDPNESTILFNTTPNNKYKAGLIVIPADVESFNYNNSYIVAKNIEEDTCFYWIIDKKVEIDIDLCRERNNCDSVVQSNLIGPIDSVLFFKKLDELKINLKLKDISDFL